MKGHFYVLSLPQFVTGASETLCTVNIAASDDMEAVVEKIIHTLRLNRRRTAKHGYVMGQPVVLATLKGWDHDKAVWTLYKEFATICPIDELQDKEAYKVPIIGKVTVAVGDIVVVTNRLHGHSWEISQRVLITDIEHAEDWDYEADHYYTVSASDFPSIDDYLADKEEAANSDDDYDFDPEMYWLSRDEFQLSD